MARAGAYLARLANPLAQAPLALGPSTRRPAEPGDEAPPPAPVTARPAPGLAPRARLSPAPPMAPSGPRATTPTLLDPPSSDEAVRTEPPSRLSSPRPNLASAQAADDRSPSIPQAVEPGPPTILPSSAHAPRTEPMARAPTVAEPIVEAAAPPTPVAPVAEAPPAVQLAGIQPVDAPPTPAQPLKSEAKPAPPPLPPILQPSAPVERPAPRRVEPAAGPAIHIGAIEVRTASPPPVTPPQPRRAAAPPRPALPSPGYAWRYGRAQS